MFTVINPFRDKTTKTRYEKGDTFLSEDKERIAFLISQKRIEESSHHEADITEEPEEEMTTAQPEQKLKSQKSNKKKKEIKKGTKDV
ncbi:hypothetical protein [Bacillus pumilus]|uniref:Uncharacterized protein n=1 Tax=Bacillus pumilus TaxID=1408 RepID=A0AAD0MLR0_BACPU|nr:hypothetical protein [Bacillus pumilus]AVM24897.1 hypothetical protein C5695_13980 [Bacillus pumilus]TYS42000.1 hypothetical protein FZC68_10765 [Bacillus pumilus]